MLPWSAQLRSGIVLAGVVLGACVAPGAARRPVIDSEGALQVYLQPFPEDASRLSFRITDVSAVAADGVEVPLAVAWRRAGPDDRDRERRFAGGPIPPGSYAGLTITIDEARLADQNRGIDLVTPHPRVRVEVPFVVERRRAVVLTLRLHGRESLDEAFRFEPAFSAAVAGKPASGLLGLATNRADGSLTLFDKAAGGVVAVIPVGRSPGGVDLDPRRSRAYVALTGEDAVEVIDLQQYGVVERLQLFGGDSPVELELTPDRSTLVVVNTGSDTISVVDLPDLTESDRIAVGDEPASVRIDETGRRAYVFNSISGTISVIDLTSRVVAATIAVDPEPIRGEFDRRGQRLYVIHRASPYLTVIDTSTMTVAERIRVGTGATALIVDSRTDRIYLARRNAFEIDIYDPISLLPVDAIPVPGEVAHMAIDDEGNNLVVVLPEQREIRILRLVGDETVARIDVGGDPFRTAFPGER